MKEIITIVKEFDKDNNLVYYKDANKEIVKKFNGKKIESKLVTAKNFKETKTYEYKDDKTIIHSITKYNDGKEQKETIYFDKDYNDVCIKCINVEGKESEIRNQYEDGKLIHSISNNGYDDYEYDENENVKYYKSVEIDKDKNTERVLEEFYEFDDHNNPTSFKLYIDKKLIDSRLSNYKYFDNGNYERTENVKDAESGSEYLCKELMDSEDRLLYLKNDKKEYWMEYEDNIIKYKDSTGFEYIKELNDYGNVISYKDNAGKEIEYVYKDSRLK